jgi:ATP-dependent DNA helicase RecG
MSIENQKPSINRIVIGDVGSGKTIVAFLVALSYLQGLDFGEVGLLAPTEVLAYQHYLKLWEMVCLEKCQKSEVAFDSKNGDTQVAATDRNVGNGNLEASSTNSKNKNGVINSASTNVKVIVSSMGQNGDTEVASTYQKFFDGLVVVFLSGKNIEINGVKFTPAKFKTEIKKLQENNKHFFWLGTHALLFSEFITPDLVLVDEQHRFGVRQRAKLTEKQYDLQPHFISFTATPIPRTLALTMYQSLKPHFLEKLANRNPILTRIATFDKLETEIITSIQRELDLNRKVYVICPAVEETEDTEEKKSLYSVTKATKVLQKYFGEQVFSVHGKMKEKKDILTEFKESKNKNILVATTVVEVGVDVRDASLVVILNAERFGLSALHQIRGRVGRNDFEQNYCILVTEKEFSFSKRLRYLCEYQDGFKLAEMDLELRGAGDMVGQAQSGFGDEVGEMLGLDPKTYSKIADLVLSQKVNNTKDLRQKLPRLYTYLEREKNRVWEE